MPTRILQISDPHLFRDPDTLFKHVPTWQAFAEMLDFVEAEGIAPDLVVLTGDLAHDERRETYLAFRDTFAERLQPLRVIPGNHDTPSDMRELFGEGLAEGIEACAFAIDVGSWRVIGLDSHVPGEVPGRIDSAQHDWLTGALATAGDRPVLVFVHHPPFPVGSPWLDPIGLREADALWETLSTANVRVVACGHVHHECRGRVGVTDVFTTPSTCMQFEPSGERSGYTDDPPGVRIFDLDGDAYTTSVLRLPRTTWPPFDDDPWEDRPRD